MDRGLRRRGIGVQRTRHDLEVRGDPHQILLHALVEGVFDAPTLGISGKRESLPRGSQLLELAAQTIDGSLLLGLPGFQGNASCAWIPGSCPTSRAPSSGHHGIGTEGSIPRVHLASTVEAGGFDLLASR